MLYRKIRAGLAGLTACGLIVVATACERNVKQVTITEANRDALAEEVRQTNALTGEEGDLLRAYLARSGDGLLPVGKTLAEMISEQRGYASRDEAPGAAGTADEPAAPSQAAQPPASARTTAGAEVPDAPATGASGGAGAEPATRATATEKPPAPTPLPLAVLPAGTPLTVSLGSAVSSKANAPGDSFEATLGADLAVDGRLLAPQGSTLRGRVVEATSSGKVKGRARLSLALEVLRVGDAAYPIESLRLSFEAESNKGSDAKKVGIGAGAGAVLGAIKDGKKGALIGTVIGAGAGTAVVLLTSGDEVELAAGQQLRFELLEDVRLPVAH